MSASESRTKIATVILNGDKDHPETMSVETAEKCGIKVKDEKGNGNFKLIAVNDSYYKNARLFSNGHITYLSPYL